MKTQVLFIIIPILLFGLTSCESQSTQDRVSAALGIDASEAEVLSEIDDHGGFHGDGTTIIVLDCAGTDLSDQISEAEEWKPFPLDDTVMALVYGVKEGTASIGPYLTDEEGEPVIPDIELVSYRLIDRQAEEGIAAGADILHRSSFNFTLGIYDTDAERLYFCEMDT